MIAFGKEQRTIDLGGGVSRKILAYDGKMMSVEVSFEKGAVGAPHSHPHEQISYVMEGKFEYAVNGEKYILEKGDTYHTLPNVIHGVVALEKGVLIDIFTPIREDFLK
jgi:quercetin dioxygenase-like cupin family protein